MSRDERGEAFRLLALMTTPKLSERAAALFLSENVPIQYQMCATGTASSEMLDMLGLGGSDREILAAFVPKSVAKEMLKKLQKALKLGALNSGVAFSAPLNGGNSLMLQMISRMSPDALPHVERKEEPSMTQYALIVAAVNQGFIEDTMDAAKAAGATGGTVLHSRRIISEDTMKFWGLSIQDEKELVLILSAAEAKAKIMQAISEKCGMHSEAKGVVFSMPVDAAIGLE